MIEDTLKRILEKKTGEKVLMEEPGVQIPGRFVLLEKTSGGIENYIRNAVIRVRAFEESMYKAAELGEMIRKVLLYYAEDPLISSIRLNQEYNYTDVTAKRYCYQLLFDVTYYERE